jgi:hypothetical protein
MQKRGPFETWTDLHRIAFFTQLSSKVSYGEQALMQSACMIHGLNPAQLPAQAISALDLPPNMD